MREPKRTQIISIVEGSAFAAYYQTFQGMLLAGLAVLFNVSEALLGVIYNLPVASQLVQVVAPHAIAIFGRKRLLVLSAAVGRISLLALPLTIAFGFRNPGVLFAVVLLLSVMGALTNIAWLSLIKAITSPSERGRFFGVRNFFATVSGMASMVLFSRIVDVLGPEKGFVVVTALSGALATFSAVLLALHYDPGGSAPRVSRRDWVQVLKDPNFKRYAAFFAVWNLAIMISAPFLGYHALVNLKMHYSLYSILAVLQGVISMALYPIWGRVADKIGHGSVADFGVGSVFLVALLWALAGENTWKFVLPVAFIIAGIVWSAINVSLLPLMLETSGENTEIYLSISSALGGLFALLGSFLGGVMASLLKPISIDGFFGIQLIFGVSAVLRLCAFVLLKRIPVRRTVPALSYIWAVSAFFVKYAWETARRRLARCF